MSYIVKTKIMIEELQMEHITFDSDAYFSNSTEYIKEIPIDGFPDFIKNFISTCSDTYQTNKDYWAGSVLIATALAIGDKIELVTKYNNVPILWLCLVGEVSSGKTEPLKLCLDYFQKIDSENIEEYKVNYKQYIYELKNSSDSSYLSKPKCVQYILKDSTPEAMAKVHEDNQRGIMYYNDELKGWIDDFGRYSKSGEQSNMLSTYNRVSMTINRKSSDERLIINKPCILVAGGMQPGLLPTLAKDDRAENGFLSRFCFVFPENTRKQYYSNAEAPDEMLEEFNEYLEKLLNIDEVFQTKLSSEAENIFAEWYDKNADETNNTSIGYLEGVYGKLDIMCLRIAVVIRGMKFSCNEANLIDNITKDEMQAATHIVEYFRHSALKVYDVIFNKSHYVIDKKAVAKYLHNQKNPKTKIAEVLKTSRSQVDRLLK